MDKLKNIIESILFLSGTAIEIKDISAKLNIEAKEIEKAVKELQKKYSGESGIQLMLFNRKLQFSTNPEYASEVETVLNPIKEKELSKAMMEVAAIVAYKQPVTRLEIEEVRGVNSDYAVNTLAKHNLIEVVGRKDAIGKPLLYGTTDEFLKRFQISSIGDLPDYDELISRIKVLYDDSGNSRDLYFREQYNPDTDPANIITADEINTESEFLQALDRQKKIASVKESKLIVADNIADNKKVKSVSSKPVDDSLETDVTELSDATLVEADEKIIIADEIVIASEENNLVEADEIITADEIIIADEIITADDIVSADAKVIDFSALKNAKTNEVLAEVAATLDQDEEEIPDFLKGEKDIKIID